MSSPERSIVIPTWNGAETLSAHLPSVLRAAERAAPAEVVVYDDGSDDDTAEVLGRKFPAVRLIRSNARGGFARASNGGVAAASGRIVLLLNNDMEVAGDAFVRLSAALESDASVFATVPSILRSATGREEAHTRIRFRHGVVSTDIDGDGGGDPAYACGGAMAFRRADFQALGGFDPLYSPFYWEDVDLSYRARKRGCRIAFVGDAGVVHDHGRTIGAHFDRAAISRIYERNRLIFTWKNLTDRSLFRAHLALLPAKTVWDAVAHRAFVRGLAAALRVRGTVAERRRVESREAMVPDRDLLC